MNAKNFNHSSNIYFGCDLFSRDFIANVQRVNLPGISFNNISMDKMATHFFKQGCTPVYSTLSLDLIIDENLNIWKEMVNKLQTMTSVGVGDLTMTEFTSFIHIFNEKDKSILKIDFIDCILNSLGDIQFESTGDDTELVTTLTIDYAFYRINDKHKEIKRENYEQRRILMNTILSENYDNFKEK